MIKASEMNLDGFGVVSDVTVELSTSIKHTDYYIQMVLIGTQYSY